MALDAAFWTSVVFAAFLGVIALIAFAAYWSLRRMDDVVLRARMYMNRKRLFTGFLWFAAGMLVVFAASVVALALTAAGITEPIPIVLGGYFLALGFVAWGCYNLYALSRPPPPARPTTPEGK